MELFSSRELAIGFWLIVVLTYLVYSDSFRPHLKQVIQCFCNIYILAPIIGLGGYIIIVSYFLVEISIWNLNQYKNVTLWFLCVGIYSLFQVSDVGKGEKYLKDLVFDLFKITTLFEFVVTFHSFSFWFEIVFIPFVTLIMLVAAFSDNKKEHKIVSNFLGKVIEVIGGIVIIYVGYQLLYKPEEFFNEGTIYDFMVPIILTIVIFPYLYFIMLYAKYERIIVGLTIRLKDDELVRYTTRNIIFYFKFCMSCLDRWNRYITLHDVKSKSDIDKSIKRIIFLMKRDKLNIPVSFEKGWSHFDARRYLSKYGLLASYYDHLYDDKWTASSEYFKLGEGYFCNKIKYYIDGCEDAVKCLTLVLVVEDIPLFQEALNKFRDIGNYIFEKSISKDKELSIKTEEVEGEGDELYETNITEIEGRQIMIQKYKYINREEFELRLSFAVDKESFKYLDTIK